MGIVDLHPVQALVPAPIDMQVQRVHRVVMLQRVQWDVGAFQLGGTLGVELCNADMHGLQG